MFIFKKDFLIVKTKRIIPDKNKQTIPKMYASCYEEVLVTVYTLRKEMVEKPENTPAKLAMNLLYKPEKIIKTNRSAARV